MTYTPDLPVYTFVYFAFFTGLPYVPHYVGSATRVGYRVRHAYPHLLQLRCRSPHLPLQFTTLLQFTRYGYGVTHTFPTFPYAPRYVVDVITIRFFPTRFAPCLITAYCSLILTLHLLLITITVVVGRTRGCVCGLLTLPVVTDGYSRAADVVGFGWRTLPRYVTHTPTTTPHVYVAFAVLHTPGLRLLHFVYFTGWLYDFPLRYAHVYLFTVTVRTHLFCL